MHPPERRAQAHQHVSRKPAEDGRQKKGGVGRSGDECSWQLWFAVAEELVQQDKPVLERRVDGSWKKK